MHMDPFAVTTETLRPLGTGFVSLQQDYASGIALIELRHPERHNAFSGKMIAEFRDIVLKLEALPDESDLVAVIMTGCRGKAFCSGIDLVFTQDHLGDPRTTESMNRLMYDTLNRFSRLPLISVAAVAGAAIGGGSELATAFDYICMDTRTHIAFVQTRRGVSSPWSGARRLVARIGRKNALRVMAGAPMINAAVGKELGIVDVAVTSRDKSDAYDACLAAAVALIQPFIIDQQSQQRVSPQAVRGMKAIIASTDQLADVEFDMALFRRLIGSAHL